MFVHASGTKFAKRNAQSKSALSDTKVSVRSICDLVGSTLIRLQSEAGLLPNETENTIFYHKIQTLVGERNCLPRINFILLSCSEILQQNTGILSWLLDCNCITSGRTVIATMRYARIKSISMVQAAGKCNLPL